MEGGEQPQSTTKKATSPTEQRSLSNLPDEVVIRVLQWLECKELSAVASSSHWGHRVAHDDHLWRELFKRDRRKLPYLTDLCFATSPAVLQAGRKPVFKSWRDYYKHRFTIDLENWEHSSHQLQLWDGSYNPSTTNHARESTFVGSSQQSDKPRRYASHGRTPSYDEPDDEDENESEEENSHRDLETISDAEKQELGRVTSMANERMERRKRRMVSRSVPSTTGDSRTSPALPFIPYTPHVFPQAKRKAVAFIGPRGSGKATMFYLLKFGRMFRGVRYLRKFGGIVSLDIAHLHCHLELEVWDVTTEGHLDINQRIVPFYQLHGIIVIVDGSSVCATQCAIIRDILQRIINTPPASQTSIRKDSTTVVDYCWLFPPPVLIFANKCDLQPEPRAYDVATMLNLDGTPAYPSFLGSWNLISSVEVLGQQEGGSALKGGRWRVQCCSALDGRGVIPGVQWLHETMQANN